jgi:integral membrane protein (TIGR01906 family)
MRNGARGLAVGVIVAGVVVYFAFDAVFELFHRLFFPGGTYTFDPATDRLVQLFPFDFWIQSTMAVGLVIFVLSIVVALIAGRRGRQSMTRTSAAPAIVAEAAR